MSVDSAIQTFSGIANENEFYGHHYLAEVFQGDIKALIDQWNAAEEAEQVPVRVTKTGKIWRPQRTSLQA